MYEGNYTGISWGVRGVAKQKAFYGESMDIFELAHCTQPLSSTQMIGQ